MNKSVLIGIVVILVLAIVGVGGYYLLSDKPNEKTSSNNSSGNENDVKNDQEDKTKTEENNTPTSNEKTLVVYYSATGSTKKIADQIAENLNADLFEIVPEDIYTSEDLDWTNENSRVTKEHLNESLRDVKLKNTKVENWASYDTVLIGYPIWWGIAAWPVDNFMKENDFTGKTIIPFCTSASSGLGQSGELLKEMTSTGNWLEGHRFSSGASSSDIKTWTDSIK